ncbi:hypothetical protein WDW89_05220, partial [Deltaproteobacteria bacterium TL4]
LSSVHSCEGFNPVEERGRGIHSLSVIPMKIGIQVLPAGGLGVSPRSSYIPPSWLGRGTGG